MIVPARFPFTLVFLISTYSIWSDAIQIVHGTSASSANSCAVRLASSQIHGDPDVTQRPAFCSGTVIGNRLVATAAHCMSEVFTNLGDFENLKKSKSAYLALSNSRASSWIDIPNGPSSIISSTEMKTEEQRKKFIEGASIAQTANDFALFRLKNDVPDYVAGRCPRLPSGEDCEVLANFIKGKSNNPDMFASNFYLSSELEMEDKNPNNKIYYPSSNLVTIHPVSISSNPAGYFIAKYQNTTRNAHIRRGDSGAGIIWNNNGRMLLIGVLSGSNREGTEGYFANLCPHVSESRWQSLLSDDVSSQNSKAESKPASR